MIFFILIFSCSLEMDELETHPLFEKQTKTDCLKLRAEAAEKDNKLEGAVSSKPRNEDGGDEGAFALFDAAEEEASKMEAIKKKEESKYSICDMIKRNESDVGDVVFEILAKTVFKFLCFIVFLALSNPS